MLMSVTVILHFVFLQVNYSQNTDLEKTESVNRTAESLQNEQIYNYFRQYLFWIINMMSACNYQISEISSVAVITRQNEGKNKMLVNESVQVPRQLQSWLQTEHLTPYSQTYVALHHFFPPACFIQLWLIVKTHFLLRVSSVWLHCAFWVKRRELAKCQEIFVLKTK